MTIMYSNHTGISGLTLPTRKILRFLTARTEKGCTDERVSSWRTT